MKPFITLVFVVLLMGISVACASEEIQHETQMVHIGNYDIETTNKMILAANTADIEYYLSAPYGEGCTLLADCTWAKGDTAFHIEKGKEPVFWKTWETLYCSEGSTAEQCFVSND